MTLRELATRLGATSVSDGTWFNEPFRGYALDHRGVQQGQVFIAIKGARVDGHDFVHLAHQSGAIVAIVERPIAGPHILVPNVVNALADLGRSIRAEFKGPVVGITGSNGKTTAKELVASALSPLGPILKNQGNQNSEFTSPLTWLELAPEHRAAVIEMGMRGMGQIRHLADISKPNLALITMIGSAHIEMVGNRQGIAAAKAELFEALPSDGIAHLWAEDEFAAFLASKAPSRVRTFGESPDAEMQLVGYRALGIDRCEVFVQLAGERAKFELPTVGRHQALNGAAALLVATSANVSLHDAVEAIQGVRLPSMRMEVRQVGEATVLLDTYNASPDSMVAALRTLSELPCQGRRLAVLGEMKELGSMSALGHRQVGREVALSQLDQLVLYGAATSELEAEALQAGFPLAKVVRVQSLDDVRGFLDTLRQGDLVLIKGSRALELERALPQEAQA